MSLNSVLSKELRSIVTSKVSIGNAASLNWTNYLRNTSFTEMWYTRAAWTWYSVVGCICELAVTVVCGLQGITAQEKGDRRGRTSNRTLSHDLRSNAEFWPCEPWNWSRFFVFHRPLWASDNGNNVMADKGFDIKDVLAPHRVKLNILPFCHRSTGNII